MSSGPQGRALLYYLGNKSRIVEEITGAMLKVGARGRVVDLFSGTGSVSLSLSKAGYDVAAVDVQEYSRALCSALIRPAPGAPSAWMSFTRSFEERVAALSFAYEPLLELEADALDAEEDGWEALSEMVEHGCLLDGYRQSMREPLASAAEESLDRAKKLGGVYDAAVRHFGGVYFSYRQAICLAAARGAIGELPSDERDLFLGALLSAASRCTATVGGQFAQAPATRGADGSLKTRTLKAVARKRTGSDVFKELSESYEQIISERRPRPANEAHSAECESFLESGGAAGAGAIYADPPYSRYHYSRYYHVLETLARGDDPSVSANPATGLPSRGVYRVDRYQSPYSTRTGAAGAFERLFELCAKSAPSLILSYSPYPTDRPATPRMATVENLASLASKRFDDVEVRTIEGSRHSKLADKNHMKGQSEEAEVLIICKNR